MGSISTLIYTSELILCFTICVLSATRHNIHMYPNFFWVADGNRKWDILSTFSYLSSDSHIHIAKYLFFIKDE